MATTAGAGAPKNTITLKGSTHTVTEFFECALSSILYQRGVYPPELFHPQKKYGLTVMAVKETKLAAYLQAVLQQVRGELDRHCSRMLRSVDCSGRLSTSFLGTICCRLASHCQAAKGGVSHYQHRQQGRGGALDV
jgi:hypothetical protein